MTCEIIILGLTYVAAFHTDTRVQTSRLYGAMDIEDARRAGLAQLRIAAEPAPYILPPVNLFDWPIILSPSDADVRLLPPHVLLSPISWTDKMFITPRDPRAGPSATQP